MKPTAVHSHERTDAHRTYAPSPRRIPRSDSSSHLDERLYALRDALRAARQGDFSVRLLTNGGADGVMGEVALAFNALIEENDALVSDSRSASCVSSRLMSRAINACACPDRSLRCQALVYLHTNNDTDLILLDMMMPVMDGWKFREEQRKVPALALIPVVVVTADGDVRGKAASIQAAGYAVKPISIDSLLDAVEQICGLAEAN